DEQLHRPDDRPRPGVHLVALRLDCLLRGADDAQRVAVDVDVHRLRHVPRLGESQLKIDVVVGCPAPQDRVDAHSAVLFRSPPDLESACASPRRGSHESFWREVHERVGRSGPERGYLPRVFSPYVADLLPVADAKRLTPHEIRRGRMQLDVALGAASPEACALSERAAPAADLNALRDTVRAGVKRRIRTRQYDHALARAGPEQRLARILHELHVSVPDL